MELLEPHNLIPPGVYTLDGMMKYGEENKQCPYFTARRMVTDHGMTEADSRCHSAMSSFIPIIICLILRSRNEYRESFQRIVLSSLTKLTISVCRFRV